MRLLTAPRASGRPLQCSIAFEILLYRDGDEEPEFFVLVDEGQNDAPPACLPERDDFIVIDRTHMGKVTSRTFAYDLDNEGLCHVMINADRVTRPPCAVNSNNDRSGTTDA